MIPFDNRPGIGWGPFRLPDSHPFYEAAACHDRWYDDLAAGTATKTLKQIDKEFLRNCLRIAWSEKSWLLAKEAYLFYRICRFWAKNFRPELEKFVPQ